MLSLKSKEASEEFVKSKCLPVLLYGFQSYSLLQAALKSLNFVVTARMQEGERSKVKVKDAKMPKSFLSVVALPIWSVSVVKYRYSH